MDATEQGIRKVAILVSSLQPAAAEAVLRQIGPARAAEVRRAMRRLGPIDPEEQRQVLDEFQRAGRLGAGEAPEAARRASGGGVELDADLAQRLGLASSKPRSAAPTAPTASSGSAGPRPFAALADAEADKLAGLLSIELPQTIALVLAHLTPEQSGAVLVRLPPGLQAEVLRRLIDLEEIDPEVLAEVEAALQSRLNKQVPMQRRRVAGIGAVSGILQSCAGPVGMQIIENLSAYDPKLAEQLAPPGIDFDDLSLLDDASLALVFRTAGDELTQVALIGASPRLVTRLIGRLPIEQAAALREAIELPGVIRLSDVEDARAEVAEVARRLAAQGRIRLPHQRDRDLAA